MYIEDNLSYSISRWYDIDIRYYIKLYIAVGNGLMYRATGFQNGLKNVACIKEPINILNLYENNGLDFIIKLLKSNKDNFNQLLK